MLTHLTVHTMKMIPSMTVTHLLQLCLLLVFSLFVVPFGDPTLQCWSISIAGDWVRTRRWWIAIIWLHHFVYNSTHILQYYMACYNSNKSFIFKMAWCTIASRTTAKGICQTKWRNLCIECQTLVMREVKGSKQQIFQCSKWLPFKVGE